MILGFKNIWKLRKALQENTFLKRAKSAQSSLSNMLGLLIGIDN